MGGAKPVPRESQAAKRERAVAIVAALEAAYPKSCCALRHASPFQLLVATVLSAQTTDLAVNAATSGLFAAYPTPERLASAKLADIERHIQTIGLWRAKAKNIQGIAQALVANHAGDVPRRLEDLVALPGVGRKTATAVLGTAFGEAAGITVDTHMLRIQRLLKLSKRENPEAMAKELEAIIPRSAWTTYTHRIIDHGRLVCVARRPRCGVCPLAHLCPSAGLATMGYKVENDARVPASASGLSWKAWEAA